MKFNRIGYVVISRSKVERNSKLIKYLKKPIISLTVVERQKLKWRPNLNLMDIFQIIGKYKTPF